MGKFWEWNKKVFRSKSPVVEWDYRKDHNTGEGYLGLAFGGSKMMYGHFKDKLPKQDRKLINCKDAEVIDHKDGRLLE